MDNREREILEYLIRQTTWSTAAQIASALFCSIRSVKTYVSYSNTDFPGLILSSREGFLLSDRELCATLLAKTDGELTGTYENRKSYILQKLLLENQQKNLEDLANELHISLSALSTDIVKLKLELTSYDLSFKTKNSVAYIEGFENNKKKMIAHLIYEQTKDFFSNLDLLQTYFPTLQLKTIRQCINDQLIADHYFIDDFSLSNLIMHICITMTRDFLSETSQYDSSRSAKIPKDTHDFVVHICTCIGKTCNFHFSKSNIDDFSIILMTRLVSEHIKGISFEQLKPMVGVKITKLMEEIQNKTYETFHVALCNKDFIVRFSLHLKNMLVRSEDKIELKNPQLSNIKASYPYIYEVSIFIANIITEHIAIQVPEDEIAYIALHVGSLVEEQYALKKKIKVIVICPQYYSTHLRLVKQIRETFSDSLIISAILTNETDLKDYSNYDFIISTITLALYPSQPFLLISTYFKTKDIAQIANMIEYLQKERQRSIMKDKLQFLFKEDFFYPSPSYFNQHDAIEAMSNDLLEGGFIDKEFKQKLFEREKVSSSAYSNIAMPHPLEKSALKTVIAVSIHPHAIEWNTSKVHIVFLLAINQEDRILFKDIFDFVTEIITNKQYLKTILTSKTYQDFIGHLISYV